MTLQTIIRIAGRCGWSVTVRVADNNRAVFDFRRNTRRGVPFCFCACMTGGRPATLVDEILSFIDVFQPGVFARKWCRQSGVGESLHAETAVDFDDMRAEAWILAIELSDAMTSPERQASPWYLWN